MKKEARILAKQKFFRAKGNITNREIAKALTVNPLTVGKWKRLDCWEEKLEEILDGQPVELPGPVVRKKAARDKAFKLYMDRAGNISNKDLAKKVGVSPATIAKWKKGDDWIEQIRLADEESFGEVRETKSPDLDMGDLAAPEQIIHINRKIDLLLTREHLTAQEIAHIADAKTGLLEALEIYLTIVREVSEIRSKD